MKDFRLSLSCTSTGTTYFYNNIEMTQTASPFPGAKAYRASAEPFFEIGLIIGAGKIKAWVEPFSEAEFGTFKLELYHNFDSDEVFFANGYQSWSTSREYTYPEKESGVTPLASVTPFTKKLAAISGDYNFVEHGKSGVFHSHTYTYFRKDKHVTLLGSLSEKNGFTVFTADMNNNLLTIEKDVDGLVTDHRYDMLDIAVISGDYDFVFDRYFFLAGINKPRINRLAGYTSWYNYFQKIDEHIILRDLRGLSHADENVNVFQIDDGYEPAVGDWLIPDKNKFPGGMKKIADEIHKSGYLAGIWLAPFNCQRNSQVAKEHPEWILKDSRGKNIISCAGWGGAYTFDVYNKSFREHIKNVFDTVLNDWGYDLVKLDFLYSQCMEPRNGKTRGTIMCEAMEFLRECVGEKLILGCGVPLGASFGVADACRISCDVDLKYSGKIYNTLSVNSEIPSAQNAINNTIFRRHLNGRAFCSDPDVFFLRNDNLDFTDEQKQLLATVNSLFGSVLFVSDNVGEYREEELEFFKDTLQDKDIQIISAQKNLSEDFEIVYSENGKRKLIIFNLKTGKFLYRAK